MQARKAFTEPRSFRVNVQMPMGHEDERLRVADPNTKLSSDALERPR